MHHVSSLVQHMFYPYYHYLMFIAYFLYVYMLLSWTVQGFKAHQDPLPFD